MAKGTTSKKIITDKLVEVFEGAFLYNDGKEVRIPMIEDGEEVQIKVTLTAAKTAVTPGDDVALPGITATTNTDAAMKNVIHEPIQASEEEKANIAKALSSLGL